MAIVRKSLSEIMAGESKTDWAKVDATTEDEIRRHMAEDGEDPNEELRVENIISPQVIRKRLNMTQEQFADAIRVPLATLRNWEQGRVQPDPAARSLLTIVARDPRRALKLLAGGVVNEQSAPKSLFECG